MDSFLSYCENGDLNQVIEIIESGSQHDATRGFLRASYYGRLDVMKYLAEHGADIHVNDDEVLEWASFDGQLEVLKFLVEHGADINADDDSALKWCCYKRNNLE